MTIDELEADLRAILVPYEDELETAEIYGMPRSCGVRAPTPTTGSRA